MFKNKNFITIKILSNEIFSNISLIFKVSKPWCWIPLELRSYNSKIKNIKKIINKKNIEIKIFLFKLNLKNNIKVKINDNEIIKPHV